MFYLVILYCGVLVKGCSPIILPGDGFPTFQTCNEAGQRNSKENHSNVAEWTCIVR